MLDTTPANCRQLFHRARLHIADRRPRYYDTVDAKRPLVGRFVDALRAGDGDALTSVLAEDVGFWSDGGGKVLAARRPIFGRDHVVQVLVGIRRTAPSIGIALEAVTMNVVEVNHEPSLVLRVSGHIDSVYTFSIENDAITAIRIVRNPDKLRFLDRQLSGA
jgi:hypothetical protein